MLRIGDRGRALEDIERSAGVTASERDEVFERIVGQGDAPGGPSEPASPRPSSASARRTTAATSSSVRASSRQPHPRQEGGVDLEVGVLGRRPDQRGRCRPRHGAARVLLRLVEAADLVEEEHRARPVQVQPVLRVGDGAADLDDARHDSRHRREMRPDLGGEKAGEARLAGPGRSPQQERREMPAVDAPAERPTLTDEVVLADELVEAPWDASGRRAAVARAVAGRGPRAWRRPVDGRMACP